MKNKLKKYETIRTLPNVIEAPPLHGGGISLADEIILPPGNGPLTLELGCGRGEYTMALARLMPDCRFIGVDIKGARLWHGATLAMTEGLSNVLFLRTRIELLNALLPEGSVSEIWIPFPEPFIQGQSKYIEKRLTSATFLAIYRKILKPGGIINLKTDSDILYRYTLNEAERNGSRILFATTDLYSARPDIPGAMVRSAFEQHYHEKGTPIKYLRFVPDAEKNKDRRSYGKYI